MSSKSPIQNAEHSVRPATRSTAKVNAGSTGNQRSGNGGQSPRQSTTSSGEPGGSGHGNSKKRPLPTKNARNVNLERQTKAAKFGHASNSSDKDKSDGSKDSNESRIMSAPEDISALTRVQGNESGGGDVLTRVSNVENSEQKCDQLEGREGLASESNADNDAGQRSEEREESAGTGNTVDGDEALAGRPDPSVNFTLNYHRGSAPSSTLADTVMTERDSSDQYVMKSNLLQHYNVPSEFQNVEPQMGFSIEPFSDVYSDKFNTMFMFADPYSGSRHSKSGKFWGKHPGDLQQAGDHEKESPLAKFIYYLDKTRTDEHGRPTWKRIPARTVLRHQTDRLRSYLYPLLQSGREPISPPDNKFWHPYEVIGYLRFATWVHEVTSTIGLQRIGTFYKIIIPGPVQEMGNRQHLDIWGPTPEFAGTTRRKSPMDPFTYAYDPRTNNYEQLGLPWTVAEMFTSNPKSLAYFPSPIEADALKLFLQRSKGYILHYMSTGIWKFMTEIKINASQHSYSFVEVSGTFDDFFFGSRPWPSLDPDDEGHLLFPDDMDHIGSDWSEAAYNSVIRNAKLVDNRVDDVSGEKEWMGLEVCQSDERVITGPEVLQNAELGAPRPSLPSWNAANPYSLIRKYFDDKISFEFAFEELASVTDSGEKLDIVRKHLDCMRLTKEKVAALKQEICDVLKRGENGDKSEVCDEDDEDNLPVADPFPKEVDGVHPFTKEVLELRAQFDKNLQDLARSRGMRFVRGLQIAGFHKRIYRRGPSIWNVYEKVLPHKERPVEPSPLDYQTNYKKLSTDSKEVIAKKEANRTQLWKWYKEMTLDVDLQVPPLRRAQRHIADLRRTVNYIGRNDPSSHVLAMIFYPGPNEAVKSACNALITSSNEVKDAVQRCPRDVALVWDYINSSLTVRQFERDYVPGANVVMSLVAMDNPKFPVRMLNVPVMDNNMVANRILTPAEIIKIYRTLDRHGIPDEGVQSVVGTADGSNHDVTPPSKKRGRGMQGKSKAAASKKRKTNGAEAIQCGGDGDETGAVVVDEAGGTEAGFSALWNNYLWSCNNDTDGARPMTPDRQRLVDERKELCDKQQSKRTNNGTNFSNAVRTAALDGLKDDIEKRKPRIKAKLFPHHRLTWGHLPSQGFLPEQCKLVDWPKDVPTFMEVNPNNYNPVQLRALAISYFRGFVRLVEWTNEEKMIPKNSEEWNNIALIVNVNGKALLTVGDALKEGSGTNGAGSAVGRAQSHASGKSASGGQVGLQFVPVAVQNGAINPGIQVDGQDTQFQTAAVTEAHRSRRLGTPSENMIGPQHRGMSQPDPSQSQQPEHLPPAQVSVDNSNIATEGQYGFYPYNSAYNLRFYGMPGYGHRTESHDNMVQYRNVMMSPSGSQYRVPLDNSLTTVYENQVANSSLARQAPRHIEMSQMPPQPAHNAHGNPSNGVFGAVPLSGQYKVQRHAEMPQTRHLPPPQSTQMWMKKLTNGRSSQLSTTTSSAATPSSVQQHGDISPNRVQLSAATRVHGTSTA